MKKALKILSDKKLGILIVQNKKTTGIITDRPIKDLTEEINSPKYES